MIRPNELSIAMNRWMFFTLSLLLVAGLLISHRLASERAASRAENRDRSEVVFWHFWGGADRDVVEDVVRQFNESQNEYFVRAIAMPGNNLQAKLFLSIAGGDPPDLVNQDDPIVGDWASRNIILPLDELCEAETVAAIAGHLLPAARKLGTWKDRLYGVCNGLDIRALYYNKTALDEHDLTVPRTPADLDQIARTIRPPG
ncbi:MAG: ABC transporter substrate-binding protein, partial [Pirellulaceae bacterium]